MSADPHPVTESPLPGTPAVPADLRLSVIVITMNEVQRLRRCLESVPFADEIVVVQEGRIVERGTHAQLMSRDGLYRKLNEIQSTDSL